MKLALVYEIGIVAAASVIGELIFVVAQRTAHEPGWLSIATLIHAIWLALILWYAICAWRDLNKSTKGEVWKSRKPAGS